jgi:hypothetical protein
MLNQLFLNYSTKKQTDQAPLNHVPLIILGMHRSGTSLLANWLYQCGFNLGDEILGSGNGNSEGHFEDMEILRLHEQILQENSLNYKVTKPKFLNYSEKSIDQAKNLFDAKKRNDCWGWKDPRTCLMMDIWNQVIPTYNTIVIYRDFTQVVDSFLRRKHNSILKIKNPIYRGFQKLKYKWLGSLTTDRLLKVWMEYNRRILEDLKKLEPENYLVINESILSETDFMVFQHLQQKWNYKNTHYVPINRVFVSSLFHKETIKHKFDPILREKAEEITRKLNHLQYQTKIKLLSI